MRSSSRILLVGNYDPDRQHSMLRYAVWLTKAMQERGLVADLIVPRVRLARLARGNVAAQKWLGFLDKFVLFPLELRVRARNYDLVHICDHTNAPCALALGSRPVSVTCHDLIPIKVLSGEIKGQSLPRTGQLLQRMVRSALKRVLHLAFVSESTRADFCRLIDRPGGITEVIHNPVIGFGTMHKGRATEVMQRAGLPPDRPFVLHIGSNLWYKNRVGAVRLFGLLRERADWASALPGAYMICIGPPLPEDGVDAARGWQKDLVVISEPAPELIEALYTRATALLYPSLDEGFGWPIIEAQACGCPVITSNREPMQTIAGPAALVIDPADLPDAAQTIAARWTWLISQSEPAREHAHNFSEAAAAERYADFLARVIATSTPAGPA